MRRILAITALLSVFGATPVAAQPYVSASGGGAFLADSDLEMDGVGGAEAEFDTGFGVTGAFGWAWDTVTLGTMRAELELGYRSNDLDTISGPGGTFSGGDVEVNALSGMANVALDLDTGTMFQPYVMGGLGLANVELQSDDANFEEDDTVFAFQAGAGINVPVGAATLFGGYRFFGTSDPVFEDQGAELETEYNSHNFEVGVRFGF